MHSRGTLPHLHPALEAAVAQGRPAAPGGFFARGPSRVAGGRDVGRKFMDFLHPGRAASTSGTDTRHAPISTSGWFFYQYWQIGQMLMPTIGETLQNWNQQTTVVRTSLCGDGAERALNKIPLVNRAHSSTATLYSLSPSRDQTGP